MKTPKLNLRTGRNGGVREIVRPSQRIQIVPV
jgi:hypothetical protein